MSPRSRLHRVGPAPAIQELGHPRHGVVAIRL